MSISMVETIVRIAQQSNPRIANPWPVSITIPDLNMVEQAPFGNERLCWKTFGPWFRDVLGYQAKIEIAERDGEAVILAWFHDRTDMELFRLAFDHWWQGIQQ